MAGRDHHGYEPQAPGRREACRRGPVSTVGSARCGWPGALAPAGRHRRFPRATGERGLRLSRTGDVVQFGFELWGKRPARFAVQDPRLTLGPPDDKSLTGPMTTAAGLAISAWENEDHPTLNGTPLALKPYETSRSLAIPPDGQRFLLGTEWSLRLFNRDGTEHWQVAAPGAAWAVTIAPAGAWLSQVSQTAHVDGAGYRTVWSCWHCSPTPMASAGCCGPRRVLPGLSGR